MEGEQKSSASHDEESGKGLPVQYSFYANPITDTVTDLRHHPWILVAKYFSIQSVYDYTLSISIFGACRLVFTLVTSQPMAAENSRVDPGPAT